ncbi:hypothetical protein EDB85DRAFT_249659 [Lactarius pseudohatsudake]|nr:hypothetical protein EDB85DRAFT_249659 [Lactarius pseudohatsudake]
MELLSVLCMCISKRFIGPLSRPASRSMTTPAIPAPPALMDWRGSQVLLFTRSYTTCDALTTATTAQTTLASRSLCGDAHRDRSQISIGRVSYGTYGHQSPRYGRDLETCPGPYYTHTWSADPPEPTGSTTREHRVLGIVSTLRGQTHGPTVLLTGSCAGGDQPPMTRAADTKKALIGRRRGRKDSLMLLVCDTPVPPCLSPVRVTVPVPRTEEKGTTFWG